VEFGAQAAIPLAAGGQHFNFASKAAVPRGISMNGMLQFATLLVATVLAVGTAVFLNWLLLRVAFQWMQPASPRGRMARSSVNLVPGTVQLVRAYGAHR
jgi:hypothetical protein